MAERQIPLPFPLPGIERVQPTISMLQGTSRLTQCATCGVAVAIPDTHSHRSTDPLGACPRCDGTTWWNQADTSGLGPFCRTADHADFEWSHIVEPWLDQQKDHQP